MAQSTTLLTLPQLVDAALMSPELGTVNFRFLHKILLIIISQVGINDVKVEFKGNESELLQKIYDAKVQTGIQSTEYKVTGTPDTRGRTADGANVVIVPTNGDKEVQPAFTVAVTTEEFTKLTNDVEGLKEKYKELTQMSNNGDLITAARSNTSRNSGPINDMYQLLSLTKRVEAAEVGMKKLASMIEDLAKGNVPENFTIPEITENIDDGNVINQTSYKGDEFNELVKRVTEIETKLASEDFGTHLPKLSDVDGPVIGQDFSKTDLTVINSGEAFKLIQKEIKNVRNVIQTLNVPELQKDIEEIKLNAGKPGAAGDLSNKMTEMEINYHKCIDQINSLDSLFQKNLDNLTNQVHTIEKELGQIGEKVTSMTEAENEGQGGMPLTTIYKKIYEFEDVINNVNTTAEVLAYERQERKEHMAVIREQLELLKTIKADKRDVEEQLADKVDLCVINRKVSHDQFDTTCNDLTRGLEEALIKLEKQEELWRETLCGIQNDMGTKLDKMELLDLKEFVTNKLLMLKNKMKDLQKLKREQEAAATKAALLRDVKCISCDQEVVMRKKMDPSLYPQPVTLPPTKTMAPYLAYELDQLRKQQKLIGIGRNLLHFEQAKKGEQCNRYCGGGHTKTTPQQRVTRLGNFLEQWGPEITIVNDAEIKGKDGMIYRGEESVDVPKVVKTKTVKHGRPSMVVHGDILTSRPGYEIPERLDGKDRPDRIVSFSDLKNETNKEN